MAELADMIILKAIGQDEAPEEDNLLMALIRQHETQMQMLETMKEIAHSKSLSSHAGGG